MCVCVGVGWGSTIEPGANQPAAPRKAPRTSPHPFDFVRAPTAALAGALPLEPPVGEAEGSVPGALPDVLPWKRVGPQKFTIADSCMESKLAPASKQGGGGG